MNPIAKQKWLEALRSGEFTQGQYQLCKRERDGTYRHCCLGVLCEVFRRTVGYGFWDSYGGFSTSVLSGKTELIALPKEVQEWAGLDTHNPRFGIHGNSCMRANDANCKNFLEIADLIEAHL